MAACSHASASLQASCSRLSASSRGGCEAGTPISVGGIARVCFSASRPIHEERPVLVCHVGDYPADAVHRLNAFAGVFVGQSPKVTFELPASKIVHVYKRMHFYLPCCHRHSCADQMVRIAAQQHRQLLREDLSYIRVILQHSLDIKDRLTLLHKSL